MSRQRKLAVLGKGTAGVLAMAEILNRPEFQNNTNFEWYYDSSIKPQAVGEGSTLAVPRALFGNLGFTHHDLHNIDGTFKHGIRKMNWCNDNKDFYHEFNPPGVGYHFNAVALQNYIFDLIKDKVTLCDGNITSDEIDADYIIDCSGKPTDYSLFHEPKYIPINAAYVTQCFWDMPRFFYTLTMARPYGWVFGIPLRHRCAIGYMFNDKITDLNSIKEDVKNVFDEFNLTPSTTTNELHFKNYFRKTNFVKNIAYNGNASFFLEPLEATTLTGVDYVNKWACEIISNPNIIHSKNNMYKLRTINTERMIMLHYFAGSIFKTDFWDFAYENARLCIEEAVKDQDWMVMYEISKTANFKDPTANIKKLNSESWVRVNSEDWSDWSYYSNLSNIGLNLYDKIDALKINR